MVPFLPQSETVSRTPKYAVKKPRWILKSVYKLQIGTIRRTVYVGDCFIFKTICLSEKYGIFTV